MSAKVALMTSAHDRERASFPAYLAEAMKDAGFVKRNGDPSAAGLSRASGVHDVLLRRWLAGDTDPTIPNLRRVAPVLGLELRELMVAAGMTTAAEVGLEERPARAPAPPTTEEVIAADPRLTDRGKETLLYLAERFAQEREAELEASREQDPGNARGRRSA